MHGGNLNSQRIRLESVLEQAIESLKLFARHGRRVVVFARLQAAAAQTLGVNGHGEHGLVDELVYDGHQHLRLVITVRLLYEAGEPLEIRLQLEHERLILLLRVE